MSNLGKLATLGAVSTFLTKQFGMSPEQAEEVQVKTSALRYDFMRLKR